MTIPASPQHRLTIAVLADEFTGDLQATLASVREAADELIVIDTSANPTTATTARQAGAKLIPHEWTGDFAAVRNAALAAAGGQWVLFVDGGEEMPQEQIASLRALLALDHDRRQAYLVYIQLPPASPQGIAERMAQLRLIPNLPGVRYTGRVRETPATSLIALGVATQLSNLTLKRGPLAHDAQHKRQRALRDLKLLDKEMPEKGQQPRLLNALAECHATLGNPHAARQYYSLALRYAVRGSTEMLESYYGLLTSIDNPQHEERMTTCLEALGIYPFDAQLLCAMGNYLQICGRGELAARSYQTAVEFGQVNPEIWHLVNVAEVAALCLNNLWQAAHQDEQARSMLCEALGRLPDSVRLRRSLIELDCKYGRILDALGHVERLPKNIPHREAYRTAVRGACQAARGNWTAALGYLESAYDAGCRETVCLRWLATSLEASDRHNEALVIAREWQTLEPANDEPRKLLKAANSERLDSAGRQLRIDQPQATTIASVTAPGIATSQQ